MRLYMRNKASGELRDVEADSPEFRELQREVTSIGQPMWEQTSIPHAESVKERAATGDLYEEDLGYDQQDELRFEALKLAAEGVAPEDNPHLFLTPGEIEAGLTPEQKQADLSDMYNQKVGRRGEIFRGAAERIHGGELQEREAGVLQGGGGTLSALAGGSDDRPNAPARGDSAASSENAGKAGQQQPKSGSPAGARQPAPASSGDQSAGDQKSGGE